MPVFTEALCFNLSLAARIEVFVAILKKYHMYLIAGLTAQVISFYALMFLAEIGIVIDWLWELLLPGLFLFLRQGIHSDNFFFGLLLAASLNTGLYAILLLAFHITIKRIRRT